MIRIALVAACDRNNFGDVLLPIILEEYILKSKRESIEIDYFGLKKSDLRHLGGRKTKAIRTLDNTYDHVIIAGGEVLTSQYLNMYLNTLSNKFIIHGFYFMRRISRKYTNMICKIILHGKNELPWAFFPMSRTQKVYYNSVGGIGIGYLNEFQKSEIVDVISKSKFFSVRDSITYDTLQKWYPNNQVKLIPDTAIIMSEIYTQKELENLISYNVKKLVETNKKYIIIQINKKYGMDLIDEIAGIIAAIFDKYCIKTILLPIGRAEGHEDIIPLSEINNKVSSEICSLVEENNIFDVMYLIANSNAYLGTSLHGAITAASYGVPHSAITSEAIKLITYLETWNTTNIKYVTNEEEVLNFVKAIQTSETTNINIINKMKCIVNEYFDNIINNMR